MIFLHTTAAFTLSLEPWASSCGADLPGDWALYAVSVRRLMDLHSGLPLLSVALAFRLALRFVPALQTLPHGNALAFG